MKSFQNILVMLSGNKNAYTIAEITRAFNYFLKKQEIDIVSKTEIEKKIFKCGYYIVKEENHPWYDRIVKASKQENADGLINCYYGGQMKHFHKSKLVQK